MANWNILHISDLHIADPAGNSSNPELLRAKFYEQFLSELSDGIEKYLNEQGLGKLNTIIATGDFVDGGSVQNFDHAFLVLSHLGERFGLRAENIVGCLGNHDIVRADFRKGSDTDGKIPALTFLQRLANKDALAKLRAGELCEVGNGIWVLALDATLNCKREDGPKPGNLTHLEVEEIEGILKEKKFPILDKDLLIVASHYPLNDYSELGPIEALDERLWRGGMALAKQIARYRGRDCAPTIWLSGDIHVDLNHYNRGIYHVTTGHMGGAKISAGTIQRHEVTLLSIDSESGRATITKFQFNPKGHTYDAFNGVWERLETHPLGGETTPPVQDSKVSLKTIQPTEPISRADVKSSSRIVIELLEDSARLNATAEAISLQANILRSIEQNELYTLGRFQTSPDFATLGWVSIGPLLVAELLPIVVEHIYQWITTKAIAFDVSYGPADVVLLGVDCWGAILASQVSVRGGWRNFCVAGRGRGTLHTTFEKVSSDPIRAVANSQIVVLLTDVIGSGGTIQGVFDEFEIGFKRLNVESKSRWLAASVLCDANCSARRELSFLESIGTACSAVRLPILPTNALPCERMLPTMINFVGTASNSN